jgi:protein-tyrosine phosphatase
MELTYLPFDYPGKIYRSAMPYSSYDPHGKLLSAFKENGISLIVMLTTYDEANHATGRNLAEVYSDEGFEIIRLPIQDFGVPVLSELREVIPDLISQVQEGRAAVVHCHAGVGRTGMFMASLAKIGMGYSADEAISWVREYIPGAIEMPEQEQMVREV